MKHAEIAANARKPYAEAISRIDAERRALITASERAFKLFDHMRRNPTQPVDMNRIVEVAEMLHNALRAQS